MSKITREEVERQALDAAWEKYLDALSSALGSPARIRARKMEKALEECDKVMAARGDSINSPVRSMIRAALAEGEKNVSG